jgi:hypothetical protein
MAWAFPDTGAALNAAIGTECHFRVRRFALRIVTPPAVQRASFKENGSADPGTIMNGIATDVQYRPDGQAIPSILPFADLPEPYM